MWKCSIIGEGSHPGSKITEAGLHFHLGLEPKCVLNYWIFEKLSEILTLSPVCVSLLPLLSHKRRVFPKSLFRPGR